MRASQRQQSRFRHDLRSRSMFNAIKPALWAAMKSAVNKTLEGMIRKRITDHVAQWKQRAAADPGGHEAQMMRLYDIDAEAQSFLDQVSTVISKQGAMNGNEVQG